MESLSRNFSQLIKPPSHLLMEIVLTSECLDDGRLTMSHVKVG
jgi:hypothetical protein